MIKGTGVDIVEITRVKRAVEKREGFTARVFTREELNTLSGGRRRIESLAGKFAAKEAVSKVLGTGIGKVRWIDIEVKNDGKGRPFVKLSGYASEIADSLGITKIEITVSHSRDYAVAFAIAY